MGRKSLESYPELKKFKSWLNEEGFSQKSIIEYQKVIRHFIRIEKKLGMSQKTVDFFLDSSQKSYGRIDNAWKGRKNTRTRFILRTYLESLKLHHQIFVERPRRTRTKKEHNVFRKVLSEEQVKYLFGNMNILNERRKKRKIDNFTEMSLITRILYEGAGRSGDLLDEKPKVDNISFTDNSLTVKGKGGAYDKIFFKPKTTDMLKKYKKNCGKCLFESVSYQAYRAWLLYVSSILGLGKLTSHMLRRSCLTHMIQNGASLEQTRIYARHIDPKTTTLYIQLAGKERKEAGQKFVNEL